MPALPGPRQANVLGSYFNDNNVTYASDSPTSWVKLVLSDVSIDAGETDLVSGFNNVISYQPYHIGTPPHPKYFFATSLSEWEDGETVIITGEPIS